MSSNSGTGAPVRGRAAAQSAEAFFLRTVTSLLHPRSSLTFATEQVSSCLRAAINASGSSRSRRASPSSSPSGTGIGELDEIEIQKGLLQIGKALQFLHESAKLVHSNLTPDAIVINAKVSGSTAHDGITEGAKKAVNARNPHRTHVPYLDVSRETGSCQDSDSPPT